MNTGRRDERGAGESRAARCGHALPHNVADDEDGGVLRSLGHQVEVPADAVGSGQKGRGERHARALGKLGRSERISNRTKVLKLILGGSEPVTQRPEILLAPSSLCTQTRNQRL